LHYTSIEALFEDMLKGAANEYFSQIDQIPDHMPMEDVNRVFFTHLSKQNAFTENLSVQIVITAFATSCL